MSGSRHEGACACPDHVIRGLVHVQITAFGGVCMSGSRHQGACACPDYVPGAMARAVRKVIRGPVHVRLFKNLVQFWGS